MTRTRLIALAAMAVMFFAGCSTSQRKAESQANYKLGLSYLVSGNAQAAYVKFHEALKLDPANKEIHNGLGNVNLVLGDLAAAEKSYLEAINLDKNYSDAYNNICFVYYRRENYNAAINMCNKALENPLYPTPEKPLYNIGRSYYKLGRFKESVESFDKAIKRYPSFAQAYYGLALSYDGLENYGKASEAMGLAIGFDPNFKGDRIKAEKNFKRIRNNTDSPREIDRFIEILHY